MKHTAFAPRRLSLLAGAALTTIALAACGTAAEDSATTSAANTPSTTAAATAEKGSIPAELAGDYTLDKAHSEVGFTITHAKVSKVRGNFGDFDATFTVNEDGTGSLKAVIKTASIDTNNEDRDKHVRSADFFDVEQYPEMTYEGDFTVPGAKSADDIAGMTFPVNGNLTLKGVTKPVTLEVTVDGAATKKGDSALGFTAEGEINRTDFGVDFNSPLDSGGLLLGEDVALAIDGYAVKQ